ncbi:MAG: hypothetical protein HON04_08905 [Planctomicrobium sp.]|nr:hypothetical protein [Planctomicrobium sp.]
MSKISLIVGLLIFLMTGCSKQPTITQESTTEKHEEVTQSFGQDAIVDSEVNLEEIQSFMEQLGRDIKSGEVDKLTRSLDIRLMMSSLKQQGMIPKQFNVLDPEFLKMMNKKMATRLSDPLTGWTWERVEVRSVRKISDDEVVCYCRSWDTDGIPMKWRWWLMKSSQSWKVYDVENLDVGIRFSTIMATTFQAAGNSSLNLSELQSLVGAFQLVAEGRLDEALAQLDLVKDVKFPPLFDSMRWMGYAVVYQEQGEPEEAILAAKKAIELNSDSPIMHLLAAKSYNLMGEYESAIKEIDFYAQKLAKDSSYHLMRGDAFQGLGETDKAIEAYQAGVKDDPLSGDNIYGLIQTLPKDQDDLIIESIEKLTDKPEWFVGMCQISFDEETPATLERLIRVFKEVIPDDDNIEFYENELKLWQEEEAATDLEINPVPTEEL